MILPNVFLLLGEAFSRMEPMTLIFELIRIDESSTWMFYSVILISAIMIIKILRLKKKTRFYATK